MTTRIEHHEFLLDLDTLVAARTLPELEAGKLRSAGAGDAESRAALAAVQEAFDALGVVVTVADQTTASAAAAAGAGERRHRPRTRWSCACRGAWGWPATSSPPASS